MRLPVPSTRAARAGFTLLELTIAGLLITLLLSSAILAAKGGYGAFRATQDSSDVETRLRRALDRAALELLGVGAAELQPNPVGDFGTDVVLYRRAVGLNGTAVVWGDQNRLALELEQGELDNGIDDDGDGLVDERRLIFTRNIGGAGTQTVVLCNNVPELMPGEVVNGLDDNGNGVSDEAGFNVRRIGDILNVRLCVQQAFGEGQVATSILSTSIVLHN
jgi:type II secretory pathway pseudopilin PulG